MDPQCKIRIPTPSVRRQKNNGDPEVVVHGNVSSESAAPSSSASSELDAYAQSKRQEMRNQIGRLRDRLCGGRNQDPEHTRIFAFTPTEAVSLVHAAHSNEERLMVLLFLTTGVRVGGLARIKFTPTVAISRSCDVPDHAGTLEKNNKHRTIPLTMAVRILVTLWWRSERLKYPPSEYLFPHHTKPGQHVSTKHIWDVCRQLFVRAGITGSHAHPHTFRHTVIKMLYNNQGPLTAQSPRDPCHHRKNVRPDLEVHWACVAPDHR